ncbi:hypothetical protein [Clostridium lundense]|uniref:hypothetical protein n=1 Tax=Clostridium lundense TaxID=319475 RepID=UPI000489D4C0|nr:hypothetical protein [Clostridium lundense]
MANKKIINVIIVVAFMLVTIAVGCSNKDTVNTGKSNVTEETKMAEEEKKVINSQESEKDTSNTDKTNVAKESKEKTTSPQDVAKTSRSIFGTIKSINKNTKVIGFDDLEMITADKKERMKQIGITDKDFSNWYLYNESNEIKYYKITDKTSITIYDKNNGKEISTNINGLHNQFVSGYENHYDIKVQGDYIVEIVQRILNE